MSRAWVVAILAGAVCAGCTNQTDSGVVMGCFGLVNQTVPGQDVLAAYQGDDHLNGGTGTDTFLGGIGHTTCTSGGGTNTFVDCGN
jgi:Ca2+-binding RTX toxin-like protein